MLEEVKKDLEDAYEKREDVLKKRRDIIPLCQEGVKLSLDEETEKAKEKRREAKKVIEECEKELEQYPVIKDKLLGSSYQEYAELCIVINYLENEELPEVNVPSKYYLTGLCDAVGELKRYAMNKLGEGKIEKSEEIYEELEDLYTEINKFNYPNSMVNNLKRKKDIARKVINKLHEKIVSTKI